MVWSLSNRLSEMPGIYLADCQVAKAATFATDPKKADRLWHLSEDLVSQKFDLGKQSRL
jgi:flagellum-specific peptidoglycan hydrolase FlgJ